LAQRRGSSLRPCAFARVNYSYHEKNTAFIRNKHFVFIQPAPQQPAISTVIALAGGTWVMKTKKGSLCERWEKKDANTLHNQSYRVAGSDTSLLERVELIQNGNSIIYHSMVMDQNGGKTIPFKLVEAKDGQFIFANPDMISRSASSII
jgi:hypothetical protein